jgi:hypothetical protein
VSEQNLKLKSEIEALTKGPSVSDEKVDELTTMFRTTFADLMQASAETIVAHVGSLKQEKREEKPKDSEKAEDKEVDKTSWSLRSNSSTHSIFF